jgi:hypothetical protein
VVSGGAAATSPTFAVTDPAALYGKLVADGTPFFQVQRDGRSWQTAEPALDMTGAAILGAALQEAH